MMKRVKHLKWLMLILTLSMLIVLGACSSGSQPEQSTAPAEQPATETPAEEEKQEEQAAEPEIKDVILSTTTSTQDSGLLDVLIPIFEEQTGYNVKTIAVGTGQALAMGENGEADVLLTHAPDAEKEIEDKGAVINRKRVMYNDFVIVGPIADPAGVQGLTVEEGFQKIAETGALFVSRGDDSGTHKKELSIWKDAQVSVEGDLDWYIESGQGMGNTLQIASEREGYTLTDRATYLALKDNLNLDILIEGDESLLNIYHVMQVNPELNDMINSAGAEAFVEFMIAPETQEIIGSFGVDEYGQNLFFPYAE